MYICIYISIYTCIYVCMYKYIYICIFIIMLHMFFACVCTGLSLQGFNFVREWMAGPRPAARACS